MRLIDDLTSGTTRALERANRLSLRGYDQDELGEIARDTAALWERSLKASAPSWANFSLSQITKQLRTAGWRDGSDALDYVRRSANRDKHDAQPQHNAENLLASLGKLTHELGTRPSSAPGLENELPLRQRVRRMVCAVYEHFHTGETEYVFLEASPTDTWRTARDIDSFQIDNGHCEAVENRLAMLPGWERNPAQLSDFRSSLLESDSELWFVASLEASYEQVHEILASHQHAHPLLPGLHREDSDRNFVASVAQALLSNGTPKLVGRSTLGADSVRERLEALIGQVPARLKPLRLDRCSSATLQDAFVSAVAVDHDLGALVTDRGVLLIRSN